MQTVTEPTTQQINAALLSLEKDLKSVVNTVDAITKSLNEIKEELNEQ